MPLSPDDYTAWIGVARDAFIVVVGTFMLVYETAFARQPNVYVIGAGLTALGLPAAIRLDLRRKNGGPPSPTIEPIPRRDDFDATA